MTNLETAKKYQDYMVKVRRYLHENPELTGQEFNTVKYIDSQLTELGVEHIVVENGGVLGFIRGAKKGRTVLLRADIDALPVLEKENMNNSRCVWSKNPGVMHACGHDGHTACLLGAARVLLEKKDELEGDVILCFERGEEGGGNVKYIFAYMDKNGIKPDSCFGFHIASGLPTGTLCCNDDKCHASSTRFQITIEGRGGHGSRPDQSVSPIDCFVAIYQRMESLRLVAVDPYSTCTYSIGSLHAGSVGNVIPQTLTFTGTLRTYEPDTAGRAFLDGLKTAVDNICAAYGCTPTYDVFPKPGLATINDVEYARFTRKIFAPEFGAEHVVTKAPSMGSESYAQYLAQWPGVYGALGAGNPAKGTGGAGHNERFDIDEDSFQYGAAAHATYAIEYLKLKDEELPKAGEKLAYKEILKKMGKDALIAELYGE